MKLHLSQCNKIIEPEIDIKYNCMSQQLQYLISYIKQYQLMIEGMIDNKIYSIALSEILYFEIVDKKCLIYTTEQIYESKKSLLVLEQDLLGTTVVRINKGTLLNLSALRCIKPFPNHRLLIELINDEQLIVSRKYILRLQERIKEQYHD